MQRRPAIALLLALVAFVSAFIGSSLRRWSSYYKKDYYPSIEWQTSDGDGRGGGGSPGVRDDQRVGGPRSAATLRPSGGDDDDARARMRRRWEEDRRGGNGGRRASHPRVLRLLRSGGVGRVMDVSVHVPSSRSRTDHRIVDESMVYHPNVTDDYFDKYQLHYMEGREKDEPGLDVCAPYGDWQLGHHPTCLTLHEISLAQNVAENRSYIAGAGGIRYAWYVEEYDGRTKKAIALKNLQLHRLIRKDFHKRLHRDRIDAVALAELSASSLVVDVHGHCANAALYDFADGGRLGDMFDDDDDDDSAPTNKLKSKSVLLDVALNATKALADAHHYDERGRPTIVHGDLDRGQFVFQDGYYKLNDFNNARLLKWKVSSDNDAPCKTRRESFEKKDVSRLAKVLFYLLVGGEWNMNDAYDEKLYKKKFHGKRPQIPDEVRNGRHRFNVCLTRAIDMCYVDDPDERPSARQLAIELEACSKKQHK